MALSSTASPKDVYKRQVRATAVVAVDQIESVYSGLHLRIEDAGNSHAKDGGCQRQDGNQKGGNHLEGRCLALD